MINNKNISVKKITFLKLNNVKVSFNLFQNMSLDEILK